MEYRFSGWSTGTRGGYERGAPAGTEWYIGFKQECSSVSEAQQLKSRIEKAIAGMGRLSYVEVERLHLVVFAELRYSREGVETRWGVTNNDHLTNAVMTAFIDRLMLQ